MKMVIRLFAVTICFAASSLTFAQTTEKDLVRIPLENYIKAQATGDPESARKAFHTEGNMIWIRDGKYTTRTFANFISGFNGRSAADEEMRKRSIESIDIAGNAAIGKIILDYPTVRFVDYMTLLKINGEWKIVNKSFFAEPKQSPAVKKTQ